jgi:DNA-binding GntR family transcriptional regulator
MGISGFGPNALVRRGPDIAEYIRDLIISRQLKAGDRVRAEQIAAALDVSATPVREALRSLQAQGFLTSVHNRGFVVTRLSADDIHDVYVSIGLLVGELAARAAKTADENDLRPIRQIQASLHALQKSSDQTGVTALATEFYRQLHVLGRSPKIVSTVLMLDLYTTRELRASIPGWLEDAIQFQDLLLAAIEAHQPEVARAAVRGYMEEVAKVYSQLLETESELAPTPVHPASVQDSIEKA